MKKIILQELTIYSEPNGQGNFIGFRSKESDLTNYKVSCLPLYFIAVARQIYEILK
jgi:hypothetical protein